MALYTVTLYRPDQQREARQRNFERDTPGEAREFAERELRLWQRTNSGWPLPYTHWTLAVWPAGTLPHIIATGGSDAG
jgi:hypothetical protein